MLACREAIGVASEPLSNSDDKQLLVVVVVVVGVES
jgi:hypothetical protein